MWTEAGEKESHPSTTSMRPCMRRTIGARRLSSRPASVFPTTKAVASKRHLEYEGDDGASIFDRQREALDRRAQRAMQSATDYMMPNATLEAREAHARARLRSSVKGRDMLVESAIQNAFKNGELDDLYGKGKPFEQREENVFEDLAGMAVAHRILKSAGTASVWVEQGKKIRLDLAASRSRLARAYWRMLVEEPTEPDPEEAPKPDWGKSDAAAAEAAAAKAEAHAQITEEIWPAAMSAFKEEIAQLNSDVKRYNLIVPLSWQQQPLLSPSNELARALDDFERLASKEREKHLERARADATARRLRALRSPRPAYAFGFGATFTLVDAQPMPSMFTALRELLVDLLGGGTSSTASRSMRRQ